MGTVQLSRSVHCKQRVQTLRRALLDEFLCPLDVLEAEDRHEIPDPFVYLCGVFDD